MRITCMYSLHVCFQQAANEKQLQLLHNKIDTQVADLRTLYERNKNDSIKYFGGMYWYINKDKFYVTCS